MRNYILIFFLSCSFFCFGADPKLRTLYNSLNPQSVSENGAFYTLYPQTEEGKKALGRIWKLLSQGSESSQLESLEILQSQEIIERMVSLINKPAEQNSPSLNDHELQALEKIGNSLANRKLIGYSSRSEEEVISLPSSEVDLARGLLLSQIPEGKERWKQIRTYEVMLDLMALQIRARLTPHFNPEQAIEAMNQFIFYDLAFAFPPHSLYAKDIDEYTFLPSVLDSRRGVCLGVSILYICLAQRLGLEFELITPPGHIYVRYHVGDKLINIETTARGIDLDNEEYLGINTTSLEKRTIKETIGLAHFNQASVYWSSEKHKEALRSYHVAKKYLPNDLLLQELEAYCYLILGEKKIAIKSLHSIAKFEPEHALVREPLLNDVLENRCDAQGILAIFMRVDENRFSILKKKEALEAALKKSPKFKSALFQLAITHLQMHQSRDALACLEKYHTLDPNNPNVEYFLSALYTDRLNYPKAWEHFDQLSLISKNHKSKEFKRLHRTLSIKSKKL